MADVDGASYLKGKCVNRAESGAAEHCSAPLIALGYNNVPARLLPIADGMVRDELPAAEESKELSKKKRHARIPSADNLEYIWISIRTLTSRRQCR